MSPVSYAMQNNYAYYLHVAILCISCKFRLFYLIKDTISFQQQYFYKFRVFATALGTTKHFLNLRDSCLELEAYGCVKIFCTNSQHRE